MKKSIVALVLFVAIPVFGLVGGAASKLVGTNPGTVCTSGSDAISVLPGTTVYYCYSFTNLTNDWAALNDVNDDHLGMVMNATYVGAHNTTFAVRSYPIYLNETTNIANFNAKFFNTSFDPYFANETATVSILFPLQVFKSVSTEPPPACGSSNHIAASYGSLLYYCYQTENLSNMTISYNLNDDQLGTIVSNRTLGPFANDTLWGNESFLPSGPTLTNVATWTVNGLAGMSGAASATAATSANIPTASGTMLALLGLALIVAATAVIRLR